jgi:hypothetical protein
VSSIQFPQQPYMIEVRMSLRVQFPGMSRPFFIEGMSLAVDRYMYERYEESGDLDDWLHHQAVNFIMRNSVTQRVALDRGPLEEWGIPDARPGTTDHTFTRKTHDALKTKGEESR